LSTASIVVPEALRFIFWGGATTSTILARRLAQVMSIEPFVADDDELDRMRRYLLGGLAPPNAFAGVAERFGEGGAMM
jgi:hypothetical protein